MQIKTTRNGRNSSPAREHFVRHECPAMDACYGLVHHGGFYVTSWQHGYENRRAGDVRGGALAINPALVGRE